MAEDFSAIQISGYFNRTFISALPWDHFPFNGQVRRTEKVIEIFEDFSPTVVIETGTYRGTTAMFLASIAQNPIHTIEANQDNYALAITNFENLGLTHRIKLHFGDSAVVVPQILNEVPSTSRVFAYLDAHWEENVPLNDELRALLHWGGAFIAVIDDFYNPLDPMYRFDTYKDLVIGPELFDPSLPIRIYVPREPRHRETGAGRGTGYLLNEAAARGLDSSTLEGLQEVFERKPQ